MPSRSRPASVNTPLLDALAGQSALSAEIRAPLNPHGSALEHAGAQGHPSEIEVETGYRRNLLNDIMALLVDEQPRRT